MHLVPLPPSGQKICQEECLTVVPFFVLRAFISIGYDTVVLTISSLKSDKKCDFEFHTEVHKESHNQKDYKRANSLAGH